MKLVNYLSSNFDADDFHVGQVMSVCPGCLCYIQGCKNLRCFLFTVGEGVQCCTREMVRQTFATQPVPPQVAQAQYVTHNLIHCVCKIKSTTLIE